MKAVIESEPNITLIQMSRHGSSRKTAACGGRNVRGQEHQAQAVTSARGTFLKGLIHIGEYNEKAEGSAISHRRAFGPLRDSLSGATVENGYVAARHADSIDFSNARSSTPTGCLRRFRSIRSRSSARRCRVDYRHDRETHRIFAKTCIDRATRTLKASGALRSSIEDKVVSFAERRRHQLFLSPRGCRRRRST